MQIEELDGEEEEGETKDKNHADSEIDQIEKEKKNMTAIEKLERSLLWKAEGNGFFKKGEIFKAADAYYHSIVFCRDLMQNPQYYPNIGHNEEQRQKAKELCESSFANLALVQSKYAVTLEMGNPERNKVLQEALKSASEALKINAKNVKALFRRGQVRAVLAKDQIGNDEAQQLCSEARDDFKAVIDADPSNRESRNELKAVQEHLKQLKRDQVIGEKKSFSFASTLCALSSKEKDLLGDGSVKKVITKSGDGGLWFNEDWLQQGNASKCIVHVKCSMSCTMDAEGKQKEKKNKPVTLAFMLGDADMHDGVCVAVKSMTVGEEARFTFAAFRLPAESSLAKILPDPQGAASVWEIAFLKYVTWEDVGRDGQQLQKVSNEGWGHFPEQLAEVHMHWRVLGPTGDLIHSSRYTINMGGEGGGLQQVENEDKPAPVYILGENLWEPLAILCRSLRQGGVGELWMKQVPELPKESSDNDDSTSAKLSMMMNKGKTASDMRHCVVRAELERVVQPIVGPNDPRWEGVSTLVQERFFAERLIEKGDQVSALHRLRRIISWATELSSDDSFINEMAAARGTLGRVLVNQAPPIMDLGNVTSDVFQVAQQDLEEAAQHCTWLEEHRPDMASTHLLRAKILVAQDDDFTGAYTQLLEAQKTSPDDKHVQQELKKVKVELRRVEEENSRQKVIEIRESLKKARTEPRNDIKLMELLHELAQTKVSWETVMDTRIGVELKSCQECGNEAKKLCCEILGRLKDEAKEQRPMWES